MSKKSNLNQLLKGHSDWVQKLIASEEWELLEQARHQATHRTFKRTVKAVMGAAASFHWMISKLPVRCTQ